MVPEFSIFKLNYFPVADRPSKPCPIMSPHLSCKMKAFQISFQKRFEDQLNTLVLVIENNTPELRLNQLISGLSFINTFTLHIFTEMYTN